MATSNLAAEATVSIKSPKQSEPECLNCRCSFPVGESSVRTVCIIFRASPCLGLSPKMRRLNFNAGAERGKAMGQLLLLLGKLAGLIALIVIPLALTFSLTLSHVTFSLSGVGETKCYSGNGEQHAC